MLELSQKAEQYFATRRVAFYLCNFIAIIIFLKLFQVVVYPEADFSKVFTKNNITFLLFGQPGEFGGIVLTFFISLISIFNSFIFGSILGIARWSDFKVLKYIATTYIELFRALPIIMVIFWVFFAIPVFSQSLFGVKNSVSPVLAAIIALSLFTSAYIAEIVRAGINSIPKGQFEAAKSLGMKPYQVFILIILPQSYRKMIPAFISQFVSLFKDTSLAYTIGVIEFFRAATILNNRIFASFEVFSFVAIIYFCIAFSISKYSRMLEAKVEKQLTE